MGRPTRRQFLNGAANLAAAGAAASIVGEAEVAQATGVTPAHRVPVAAPFRITGRCGRLARRRHGTDGRFNFLYTEDHRLISPVNS
jgi:hypothetical protein